MVELRSWFCILNGKCLVVSVIAKLMILIHKMSISYKDNLNFIFSSLFGVLSFIFFFLFRWNEANKATTERDNCKTKKCWSRILHFQFWWHKRIVFNFIINETNNNNNLTFSLYFGQWKILQQPHFYSSPKLWLEIGRFVYAISKKRKKK